MEELQSLEDLLDLQGVDTDIDRLLHRRESLPELAQYRAAHVAGEEIAAATEAAQAELRQTTLELDKSEGELELHRQKAEVEERRLYAGGLGARETEHLRQEVAMLQRQASELEDRILDAMEVREQQEAEASELEERLGQARAEEQRFEEIISGEWKSIDAEIAIKEVRKSEIVPLVSSDLLELYEDLREAKEGVAIGRLADGVCGGCHLRLSAAERAGVLKEFPPRCLYCSRLLAPE